MFRRRPAAATTVIVIVAATRAAASLHPRTAGAFSRTPTPVQIGPPNAQRPHRHVAQGHVLRLAEESLSTRDEESGGTAEQSEEEDSRRSVTASASIDLPFSAETAFGAFCDFPRQPSWSNWLKSVEYIEEDNNVYDENSGGGIRTSRWTARLFGLRYSWTSVGTEYVPGTSMGWRSVSGMRTTGRVLFEPQSGAKDVAQADRRCRMTLTMSVRAPRAVAAVFRRSGALEAYFRDKILGGTLVKFRDVVMEEDVEGGAHTRG